MFLYEMIANLGQFEGVLGESIVSTVDNVRAVTVNNELCSSGKPNSLVR